MIITMIFFSKEQTETTEFGHGGKARSRVESC